MKTSPCFVVEYNPSETKEEIRIRMNGIVERIIANKFANAYWVADVDFAVVIVETDELARLEQYLASVY